MAVTDTIKDAAFLGVMIAKKITFVLMLLFLTAAQVFGQDCKWVTVEGVAALENVTKFEARKLAIDNARRAAIEMVVGVDILSETMVINYNVSGDVVRAIPYGKVLKQEIIKEDVELIPAGNDQEAPFLAYKVKMRVQVAEEKGAVDAFFRIKAVTNRNVFKEGDDIVIQVTPTRDCYLSIFNVLEDETVLILIPNRFRQNNFVKANTTFVFPDENDRRKGIRLEAFVGEGKQKTDEIFHILALKEPLAFDTARFSEGVFGVYTGKSGFVCDLIKDIVGIPLSYRAEKFIQYRITK